MYFLGLFGNFYHFFRVCKPIVHKCGMVPHRPKTKWAVSTIQYAIVMYDMLYWPRYVSNSGLRFVQPCANVWKSLTCDKFDNLGVIWAKSRGSCGAILSTTRPGPLNSIRPRPNRDGEQQFWGEGLAKWWGGLGTTPSPQPPAPNLVIFGVANNVASFAAWSWIPDFEWWQLKFEFSTPH